MQELFVVRALDENGTVSFYTGRAGKDWVSSVKEDAFPYGKTRAQGIAKSFNNMTAIHGLRFVAVPRNSI